MWNSIIDNSECTFLLWVSEIIQVEGAWND